MSEATSVVGTPGQQHQQPQQQTEQSYPSPFQDSRLPFYQNTADDREHGSEHGDNAQQQNGDTAPQPREQQTAGIQGTVPDDPHMRATLQAMMGSSALGSLDNFGALLPSQSQADHDSPFAGPAPQGSTTFRANGSPDTVPSQTTQGKAPRTKVSRACDECRRKKIRCDAVDEAGTTPCTNCARTGLQCAFSRQQLKRGPSKGYIKELAERLHSLEQQVHEPGVGGPHHQAEIQQVQRAIAENIQQSGFGQMMQLQPSHGGRMNEANGGPSSYNGHVAIEPRIGDKRSHSVAEGGYGSMSGGWNSNHRPMPLPSQQAPHLPPQSHHPGYQPSYAPSQATTQPPTPSHYTAQPFWRLGASENRHDHTSLPYEPPEVQATTSITSFDWDESVINEYYRECPASLREAFLAALDCYMRTFPTTTLPPNIGYPQALKRAAELLAKYPFDNPSTHTNATNLVYLQTLLIMALESDNHGPATIRGQAGPSRAEWLGRAAGVAGQIQINTIPAPSQSVMEGDRDSEDRLARRVWWVLFILDRWHASSTADLLKLPENSVVLLPEDQILLGESTYHLARLSFIIGHLASILTTTKTPSTDVMAPSNPASALLGLTLAGEIDRFRESVESVWGSLNLVHLSYHHCHLLIKRLNPITEPVELIEHAVKVATVLNSRLTPVTPLNHHFGALAAMTLCELCDIPKVRAEALRGLDHMVECLGEGRGLAGKQESEGWDGAIRELVVKKKERMLAQGGADGGGLQGLADAAVGGSAAAGSGGESFDPTMLTRYGYLTALGQGIFRSK
ncbi:hypothetical protein Q7P37_000785 [Cladosporium fusiforme]